MRVLLVAEQLRRRVPGGIGTYVAGLARGLRGTAGGPDLSLWASRARREPDPLASLGPLVTSPLPGRLLVRAWDRGLLGCPAGYDVLHAASLAVPPPRGTPTTVLVHDLAWRVVPDAYPPRGRRWHEGALRRALLRASVLAVPTAAAADELVAAGAPGGLVRVLEDPYGCDHLPSPDDASVSELLTRLGVPTEYLLTVSTLEPRKNLPRLLAAYGSARPRLPEPWPLLVVGPSGWGKALRPEPGVHLVGPVDGAVLAALYRRARLVAYVPRHEGFGLPAVEAMHACAPVVATPMPSTAGAALEVDPADEAAIADALVRVAAEEGLRSRLVTAGLLRAGELTWDAAARRHLDLWASL